MSSIASSFGNPLPPGADAANFEPPFNVTEGEDMDPLHALPTAHTCFNQLVVPRYGDLATFKEKLKYAIQNSIGFQMT